MSLADYHTEKTWLEPGEHTVMVDEYDIVFGQENGTKGIKITMKDDEGKKINETFHLTIKALPRLNSFAEACGLTKKEMQAWDETDDDAARVLLGKKVVIWVALGKEKNGKRYGEVKSWTVADQTLPGPGEYAKSKSLEEAKDKVWLEKCAQGATTEDDLPF